MNSYVIVLSQHRAKLIWVWLLAQTKLIEICRLVAQSKLSEGKHEEALPAAHCLLYTSIDVHGPNTIQLIPAYLLLAEANMGLDNLAAVAELLSQAEWAVLKSPESGPLIQHQLHRSLGRFHTSAGNLEDALYHFANDIYFASEEYGLDSIATSKGYFLMADIFVRQGKVLIGRSLYSKVAQTWHNHLSGLLKTHVKIPQNCDVSSDSFYGAYCLINYVKQSSNIKTKHILTILRAAENTEKCHHLSILCHAPNVQPRAPLTYK
ncbi:hypothetical protein GOODEAATRI_014135 [Goodea atripinnis]|uniref:Zinc finger, MYND-type containing 12 n=1 Tax=Goodea atripinnis TaxID=208336 RepID=A0ABV0PNF7_9TELE